MMIEESSPMLKSKLEAGISLILNALSCIVLSLSHWKESNVIESFDLAIYRKPSIPKTFTANHIPKIIPLNSSDETRLLNPSTLAKFSEWKSIPCFTI